MTKLGHQQYLLVRPVERDREYVYTAALQETSHCARTHDRRGSGAHMVRVQNLRHARSLEN